MKILVLGIHTRHIACSARRAGHTVYSLSYFFDEDLKACSHRSVQWIADDIHRPDLDRLIPAVREFLPVNHIVLGPGFELYGGWVTEFTGGKDILLNNPPHIMAGVSDKLWLADKLGRLGIPHPNTVSLDSLARPEQWDHGYPAIIKPRTGAGGAHNILVRDSVELSSAISAVGDSTGDYLLQEYISGTVASASLVSTGDKAAVISVNEQLTGAANMPFAYSGNITPYFTAYDTWMRRTAADLAVKLHLIGTNGIDFIINDHRPVVLEINPRFQGSLDTVERSTGINIFQAHYNSFLGLLPSIVDYRSTCAKTIFFAPRKLIAGRILYEYLRQCLLNGNAADVPSEGTVIEKGEPLVTFIADGHDRETAIRRAECLVDGLIGRIEIANSED